MALIDKSTAPVPRAGAIVAVPDGHIKVRALRQGFCPCLNSNGRHYLREAGDVFIIEKKRFSADWMAAFKEGDTAMPELLPDPPPTTLPTRPHIVSLG